MAIYGEWLMRLMGQRPLGVVYVLLVLSVGMGEPRMQKKSVQWQTQAFALPLAIQFHSHVR